MSEAKYQGVKTFVAKVDTTTSDGLETAFKWLDRRVDEKLPKTVTVGGAPNQEMGIIDVDDTLYEFDVLERGQTKITMTFIARRVIYYTRLID